MPELAEVEYFRRQWDPGLNQPIREVALHGEKRLFRGSDPQEIIRVLTGARLLRSEGKGKQMLFHFSGGAWLGIHLGMSGGLRTEAADFQPEKHDHLLLRQAKQTLIYRDARMFGRVRFHQGKAEPEWWSKLPPSLTSPQFTLAYVREILGRRKRAPLKALLLSQDLFLGVGNWMADEILWQAKLAPTAMGENLTAAETKRLWSKTQYVCQVAMETIGVDWGDPPENWLIHVRWKAGGDCPRCGRALERGTVGGRTTAWCGNCQTGGLRADATAPKKPARKPKAKAPAKVKSKYSERKSLYRKR